MKIFFILIFDQKILEIKFRESNLPDFFLVNFSI